MIAAITTYLNEALEELRYVRWPTHHQAIRLASIVVAFTGACAALFGLMDFLLAELTKLLLSLAL